MSRRARASTEVDAPTARGSRSLRSVLWAGLCVALLLGLGLLGGVGWRVLALEDARARTLARYTDATDAHERRLAAVYEQELALAVPDAAAHERARLREQQATIALGAALDALGGRDLGGPAAALDAAIGRWRGAPRDAGARLRLLDDVTSAHGLVTAALQRRAASSVEAVQGRIARTLLTGLVVLVGGIGAAVVLVAWIVRRTVQPLEALSRLATDGRAFPAPERAAGIREVDTLAWALHELDLAVRDREERIAEAHHAAVELSRFGEHVQQVVDDAELHEALAARLVGVSDAHAAITLVHDSGKGRLRLAHATREGADRLHLPILAEPSRCRAVRTLKPVTGDDGGATTCKCALVPDGGSHLCEPMLAAGELVGVVTLQASWRAHFTERIQERVHASLGFGATALASLGLIAAMRERAFRDPLTGAHNRAFLTEYLNKHLALAERRGAGLGVVAVDLDHFKLLNDTYGHAAGDRALMAVVEVLQREVRSADAVVRLGGEELVVVLVDTDLRGAADAAERIRVALEALAVETDKGAVTVRASFGVAAFPEHGHDQATLLAAADRALYQAKAAGRNRVVSADRASVPPSAPRSPN